MEKKIHGEYLAPEFEVYNINLKQPVAAIAASGNIETTGENTEIAW